MFSEYELDPTMKSGAQLFSQFLNQTCGSPTLASVT